MHGGDVSLRKVDIKGAANQFIISVNELKSYLQYCHEVFSQKDLYLSYSYEFAIIQLYKLFEDFIFKTIVGCVNRDSTTVKDTYGVEFSKHLSDDICEFIITKGGYFDFSGRDGLIKICSRNIGDTYGITNIIKKNDYTACLNELCALRNYAAHSSNQASVRAKKVLHLERIKPAGACLKTYRFTAIADKLVDLTKEIQGAIP